MIPERTAKFRAIVDTISTRIKEINARYRKGPSLYFYKRVTSLRKGHNSVKSFLSDNQALEILYATLVSWDMNSRGARMKYFDDFKDSLLLAEGELCELEKCALNFDPRSTQRLLPCLRKAFSELNLMETDGRLVSNSKCLHFLFPSVCMPMDRTNTLKYFYGNTNESENKYIEITQFSFEIMCAVTGCNQFIDDLWNPSIPKMIDNSVIMLMGQSLE